MGATMTPVTLAQIANKNDIKLEALRKRVKRAGLPVVWQKDRELTDAEADAVRGLFTQTKPDIKPDRVADKPKTKAAASTRTSRLDTAVFVCLMLAPAIASIQNMQSVTKAITHDNFTAWLFTIAFTFAPFVFVVAGARGMATNALTILLILVEVFCNSVRIYGGLTGFGGSGNPTRFLGIVTEMLNTGTYQTATFIAVILSTLAAAVLYAAYYQIKK